ncbi:hypothetical protein [Natrinema hispanicum]|uniref:hypothetical protein n=1 Tax=Natrinema hispanicum TaxID=392421 RepID=UPI001660060B|nr:hypothetical protein [Natrinema hispanicum]
MVDVSVEGNAVDCSAGRKRPFVWLVRDVDRVRDLVDVVVVAFAVAAEIAVLVVRSLEDDVLGLCIRNRFISSCLNTLLC